MKVRIESSSTIRSSLSGVGNYTRLLGSSLKDLDDVMVEEISLPGEDAPPHSPVKIIKGIRLRLYRKLNQFGIAPAFDRLLDPVDLTIFPDFALWPTRKSRLNAVVIHDLTYLKYPEYLRVRTIGPFKLPVTRMYLSSVTKRSIYKASFVITVSQTVRQDIQDHFAIPPEKIVVTEIPPVHKKNSIRKSSLRKKYAIPTEDYILCVGTIEPRKDQLSTLTAYLGLPKHIRQRYALVFAGGAGWSSDALLKDIKSAQAQGENVVLTGYFDSEDSSALYSHATLFTLASHYEGFGMPVLEAMAAKTPTLVSNIPVFREVCGDASLFVNPKDVKDYTGSMLQLLQDAALRDLLVTRGIANIKKYSWSQNAQRIVNKASELLRK